MIDPSPSHAVLRELFDNSALAWGLVACGVAQLSKLLIELIVIAAGAQRFWWKQGGCLPVTPLL
jgi:acid phosphatase family membrane protein YuiD